MHRPFPTCRGPRAATRAVVKVLGAAVLLGEMVSVGRASEAPEAAPPAAAAPPARPAQPARPPGDLSLIGSSCSYSTEVVLRRVLRKGTPWTFVGRLRDAHEPLSTSVASPWKVGPDDTRVVANEVMEEAVGGLGPEARVHLEGRVLDDRGIRYFVVTRILVPGDA